ncbi:MULTISPECIES: threonine synthase [unclassified Lysobacter]|uniref:threonine synthase n=1 Tax=unclassified Lysobacter TaxID=2635362 RepID=UPI0006FB0963|nr:MULTISPECIES: threonine synthase [unclassified Lysobacter]KQZ63576.1 threonine synthase [Lysobacter sp. Root559]KRC36466.1 threonine synthase [Lysobacter sp. Root76]KRD64796.1 threonine synthase [Lysobacter sp. Root96]
MNFFSTRGRTPATAIDDALSAGLAPDGGLYVPEHLPTLAALPVYDALADTAHAVLAPYFTQSALRERLPDLCRSAYAFPAPLHPLSQDDDLLLELFHGPTAAFKDYAARFLAEALAGLRQPDAAPTTIVVATSGDTGAAVAAAFHRRPGFRVLILYPDGRVSPRQAHGLGCWGDNVQALRVDGDFDDCQRLAKQALSDTELRRARPLSSANSISLGRLLPQAAYYAHAAVHHHHAHGTPLNFIVPTGNLGNACAAVVAQRMGLPIGEIRLATNANDTLPRYLNGADYAPQPTRATLANAMDVGAPSNVERLRHWFDDDNALRAAIHATAVDDATITQTIRHAPQRHGVVPCPHTATGLHLLERLRSEGDTRPWAVVATAHPAKFDSIVEPLVGHPVEPPPALAAALARPASADPLPADYPALREHLLHR